jgi:tricorn protease
MPDGKSLVVLSDESGEVELWRVPANGVGEREQLTTDGDVLRWDAVPSPDGKKIAHYDKNLRLFIYDIETKKSTKIDENQIDQHDDLAWSPDSKFLAFSAPSQNMMRQVLVHSLETGQTVAATTDRFNSFKPAWSPDGKWLYFLSDRE